MQYSLPSLASTQIVRECALHVGSHKVTLHRGASVWAPFKWEPLSLPQLNTVCQYLGHPGLIMEIWHTHTHAHKHTLYKHRKVLTPNSNLELQAITGLTVTKPKMKKRGHAVGCLGWWEFGCSDDGGAGRLALLWNSSFHSWLRQQNVFHDAWRWIPQCLLRLVQSTYTKTDKNTHSSDASNSQAWFQQPNFLKNIPDS